MSDKRKPSLMQRLMREHTLYRYLTALEKGEIETIISVMQRAADDPFLAQMIFEIHEKYQTDEELLKLLQEDESMEESYGTIHSQPGDEENGSRGPMRSRHSAWFQVLAAVLLICILGGGFLWIQVWRNPHPSTSQVSKKHQNGGWCTIPGAPLSDSVGEANLNAVAATSANDAWAVGVYGPGPLIEYWNGRRWSISAPPADLTAPDSALYGVAALAPNDVWAVGASSQYTVPPRNEGEWNNEEQPLIVHWDGQQWKVVPDPVVANDTDSASLYGVAALADNDIWAVGFITHPVHSSYTSSTLIEHWDGQQWRVVALPSTLVNGGFSSVTALDKNNVWVVGDTSLDTKPVYQNLIAHWNGQQWSAVPNLNGNNGSGLKSISAGSPNDVWATGFPGSIEHWNGQQWTLTYPKISAYLDTIYAVAPDNVWVSGDSLSRTTDSPSSPPVVAHWDGRKWSSIPQAHGLLGFLSGITSAGGRMWAVGTAYSGGYQQVASPLIESNVCP